MTADCFTSLALTKLKVQFSLTNCFVASAIRVSTAFVLSPRALTVLCFAFCSSCLNAWIKNNKSAQLSHGTLCKKECLR